MNRSIEAIDPEKKSPEKSYPVGMASSTPFLGEFGAEDYGKHNRDEQTTITIDITVCKFFFSFSSVAQPSYTAISLQVDGTTESITVRVEDVASLVQPALRQALAPLEKYRRVPKTILPPVELLTASKYLNSGRCGAVRTLLRHVVEHAETELLPLVDKLSQSNMERFAGLLSEFCTETHILAGVMAVALRGEFEKCRGERGSIMRGSSFAVQMSKLLVTGAAFSQYRTRVLRPALLQIAAAGTNQADLSVSFRILIEAITSDEAVESMPLALRHVCWALAHLSDQEGLTTDERDGQVAGLVFLRFFNPAIISPATNGIELNIEAGASSSAVMSHLKDLTRALQKFSTGQAYTEDSMASIQAVMTELYPSFRTYLQRVGKELAQNSVPQVNEEAAEVSDQMAQLFFSILSDIPAYVKSSGWSDVAYLLADLRYVHKLQLFLQSDASYLTQLEKIEENLRKIAIEVISTGDPFEVVYAAIKTLTVWHASMFRMLHERLEVEWSYVESASEWFHLLALDVEQVYEPYMSGFLFAYRNLVDISRDYAHLEASEASEITTAIGSLLTLLGRPLKRFGEILAIMSDTQLPSNHPDANVVDAFMKQGKAVFGLMREQVNVSTVLEMGQIEIQFEEKLHLIKAGRKVIRHGVLQDERGNPVEMWLFSDMLLCGAQSVTDKRYRTVVRTPLMLLLTRPVNQEECSFAISALEDDNVALSGNVEDPSPRASLRSPLRSSRRSSSQPVKMAAELKLTCSTVKQKGAWLADILGLQETLAANVRSTRKSVAREQLPNVTDGEWKALVGAGGKSEELIEGAHVFRRGDCNTSLYKITDGKVILKRAGLELIKLGVGDWFGTGSLLEQQDGEECLYDAIVAAGGAVVESAGVNLIASMLHPSELLRHLYKTATTSMEKLLRKVRLRYAAHLVLLKRQQRKLTSGETVSLMLAAVDECESSAVAGRSYSKLDVVDICLGKQPIEFTTPQVTEVFPSLMELRAYGSARNTTFSSRGLWVAVLSALENDKLVSLSKEGVPVLTKKGKAALTQPVSNLDLAAISASCEEFFGLKNQSVLAHFAVTTSKHMDRLFIAEDFICMTGGRVLGLGAEKKLIINLGHVVVCELRKKQLELVFAISLHQQPLKLTFKTLSEAATAHGLMKGKQRVQNDTKMRLYRAFPTTTFAAGSVIPPPELPCVYILGDVGKVNVVAKMAAGDLTMRTMTPGTPFVTDSAFFGVPEDTKQIWVCDANAEVTVTEVSGAALAESSELCLVLLKDLLSTQVQTLESYLEKLTEGSA